MKFLTAKTISLTLLLIIMASACSDEESPQDLVEVVNEKSIIQINGKEVEKSVTYEITYQEGNVIDKEVIAVEIDNQSLIKSDNGNWSTKVDVQENGNTPSPVKSEVPGLAGEDCYSESTCWLNGVMGPRGTILPLTHNIVTETTCTSAAYEDGVLTITITYSISSTTYPGGCVEL
ncbi:hypothetical protein [Roseivirga sp. E12]|uniref:hypothetical protein n=1 Tax=Roseivirga sp. E12 TaxID=2819237 RepID=UPI001ABC918D|nr:hypothetical protein [Roseivirga sp. E12]MBO3700629.1 hypothetical protein [Roseivirga sp. E12]